MTTTPTALTKSTVLQTLWKNIYDRIKDNVTSVSITGSVTVTVQSYSSNFPEKLIDSKSDYPIIIINPVEIPNWDDLTFTRKTMNGSFTIDIYTTQMEAADKFLDAVINSIETYRDDLRTVGVRNINLSGTNTDNVTRSSFTAHLRSCTFDFKYVFDKTLTW